MLGERLARELREILADDLKKEVSDKEVSEIASTLVELFGLLAEAYGENQKDENNKK